MCILATVLLRCMLFEVLYFLMQVALTRCILFVNPKYSRHSMLADEAFGLMGFKSCMIALLV
jgi:hypothetical protein